MAKKTYEKTGVEKSLGRIGDGMDWTVDNLLKLIASWKTVKSPDLSKTAKAINVAVKVPLITGAAALWLAERGVRYLALNNHLLRSMNRKLKKEAQKGAKDAKNIFQKAGKWINEELSPTIDTYVLYYLMMAGLWAGGNKIGIQDKAVESVKNVWASVEGKTRDSAHEIIGEEESWSDEYDNPYDEPRTWKTGFADVRRDYQNGRGFIFATRGSDRFHLAIDLNSAQSETKGEEVVHIRRAKAGSGNTFVVSKRPDGFLNVWLHLSPTNINVKEGEKLKHGQLIASRLEKVGSSPLHAHFFVANPTSNYSYSSLQKNFNPTETWKTYTQNRPGIDKEWGHSEKFLHLVMYLKANNARASINKAFTQDISDNLVQKYLRGVDHVDENGRIYKKMGGTLSWRNNNPGNIVYSKSSPVAYLASGKGDSNQNEFFKFPDFETGFRAVRELLQSKIYNEKTVEAAIKIYAPPHENNTGAYISRVEKLSGINRNKKIKDLNNKQMDKLVHAIFTHETWREGYIEYQDRSRPVPKPININPLTPTIEVPEELPREEISSNASPNNSDGKELLRHIQDKTDDRNNKNRYNEIITDLDAGRKIYKSGITNKTTRAGLWFYYGQALESVAIVEKDADRKEDLYRQALNAYNESLKLDSKSEWANRATVGKNRLVRTKKAEKAVKPTAALYRQSTKRVNDKINELAKKQTGKTFDATELFIDIDERA